MLREMIRVCKSGGTVAVIDIVAPDDPAPAASCNQYEKWRDPSHAAALRADDFRALFGEAGLSVGTAETLDADVDFEQWIRLTGTDEATAARIRGALEAEAPGGPAIGMRPFWRDGSLFFRHAYFKIVGCKGPLAKEMAFLVQAASNHGPEVMRHGMPGRMRGVLHRHFHLFPDSRNAERQTGRRAVRAAGREPALQTVRQARTAGGLRVVAAVP